MSCPCCGTGFICVSSRSCSADRPTILVSAAGIAGEPYSNPFSQPLANQFSPPIYCQGSSTTYPNESTQRSFVDYSYSLTCLGSGRCQHTFRFSYRAWLRFSDQRPGSFCNISNFSYQEYVCDVVTDHGYVSSQSLAKGAFLYYDPSGSNFYLSCTNPSQATWSAACVANYEDEVLNIQNVPPTVTITSSRPSGNRRCLEFASPIGCLSYSGCNYYIRLFGPSCTSATCSSVAIDDTANLAECGFVPPNPLP